MPGNTILLGPLRGLAMYSCFDYSELPNASSRSRAVASYRAFVNEDGSLDDVSDDELELALLSGAEYLFTEEGDLVTDWSVYDKE